MEKKQSSVLLFDKQKYTWLIAGLVVTAIGFLLMIGGASDDPEVFDDAIFSFRRLTLAPILVLAGYAMQVYAILKKTTNTPEDSSAQARSTKQKQTSPAGKPQPGKPGQAKQPHRKKQKPGKHKN